MAIDCRFPVEFQDDALRDQFVSGLGNKAIQSHCLSEAELIFAWAVTIAQGMAAAKWDAHKLSVYKHWGKILHTFMLSMQQRQPQILYLYF